MPVARLTLTRLFVIGATALLLCCGHTDRHYNVVILGIDDLRPDHLGCYGYERNTSPNMDRLAAEGVLMNNTVGQSSWTLASFGTVFTSLYPHQIGITFPTDKMWTSFPTLAELLVQSGYQTGAIWNNSFMKSEFGLSRGFQYCGLPGPKGRLADGTTRDALRWLDAHKDRPFFLLLHYLDPHEPFSPPAPYDTLFDRGYRGRFKRSFFLPEDFPNIKGVNFADLKSVTPAERNHIRSLYDGEIAFTDVAVGDFIKGLEDRKLRKKTLIVLLADHGQELFDHEGFGHEHSLFNEVIRVPLIFSLPGTLPQAIKISQQVRLIDVMPTILDLLGIRTDAHFEGVSLVPILRDTGRISSPKRCLFQPDMAYSEHTIHGDNKRSVTAYPWKLIYNIRADNEVLFDLEHDQHELQNRIAERPQPYVALEEALCRATFEMSATWYVEMASDGGSHIFDVMIDMPTDAEVGTIYFARLFDEAGHILPGGEIVRSAPPASSLSIKGLDLRSIHRLAFKVEGAPTLPMNFNLRLDGRPATQETFVGKALKHPDGMPFSRNVGARITKSSWPPPNRPSPPYFFVWRYNTEHVEFNTADISEESKRELRALGYIQ